MANFSLHIEYTDSNNLIACEQKWIDLLNPEYNTNPYPGNTKGYKHTTESTPLGGGWTTSLSSRRGGSLLK